MGWKFWKNNTIWPLPLTIWYERLGRKKNCRWQASPVIKIILCLLFSRALASSSFNFWKFMWVNLASNHLWEVNHCLLYQTYILKELQQWRVNGFWVLFLDVSFLIQKAYLISLSYFKGVSLCFFGLFEFFARAYFLQILAKFKKLAKIISVNFNPLPKTYLYTLFYQQEETWLFKLINLLIYSYFFIEVYQLKVHSKRCYTVKLQRILV